MYLRIGPVLSLVGAIGVGLISGDAHAKGGKVEYSPAIYEQMVDAYKSSQVSAQAQKMFGNGDAIGAIETDFTKFMALTPVSKVDLLSGMGQCLITSGFMLEPEFGFLVGAFDAFARNDADRAQQQIDSMLALILGGAGSSPFANAVTTGLEAAASTEETASEAVLDVAYDAVEAAATGAGAVIGNTVAGKEGAAVGAFIGKSSSKVTVGAHKKIYNWMWGSSSSSQVVASPNGEPCTPPMIIFGRPRM